MRYYIKYFLFIIIPIFIIHLCFAICDYFNISYKKYFKISSFYSIPFFMFFVILFYLFYIIYICFVIIYINTLKQLNCLCSEDIRREVFWIYNIILISLLSISILLSFVLLLIIRFTNYTFEIIIPPIYGYLIIFIVFFSYLFFYYRHNILST